MDIWRRKMNVDEDDIVGLSCNITFNDMLYLQNSIQKEYIQVPYDHSVFRK